MALRLEASDSVGSFARSGIGAFGATGPDREEVAVVDSLFCPHERVRGDHRGTVPSLDCVDCGSLIAI